MFLLRRRGLRGGTGPRMPSPPEPQQAAAAAEAHEPTLGSLGRSAFPAFALPAAAEASGPLSRRRFLCLSRGCLPAVSCGCGAGAQRGPCDARCGSGSSFVRWLVREEPRSFSCKEMIPRGG